MEIEKDCSKLVMCRFLGHATRSHHGMVPSQPVSFTGPREGTEADFSKWLAAGGLHLYLLEEGSSFALDNWLQQRASPLAGGGSLRQVLTNRLHCEPFPFPTNSLPPLLHFTSTYYRLLMTYSVPSPPKRPRKTRNNQSSFPRFSFTSKSYPTAKQLPWEQELHTGMLTWGEPPASPPAFHPNHSKYKNIWTVISFNYNTISSPSCTKVIWLLCCPFT